MQDDQLLLTQEQEDIEDTFGDEQVLQALRQAHRPQRNQINTKPINDGFCVFILFLYAWCAFCKICKISSIRDES